jgi:hypothetical protein
MPQPPLAIFDNLLRRLARFLFKHFRKYKDNAAREAATKKN